jgi:hypothetical protein
MCIIKDLCLFFVSHNGAFLHPLTVVLVAVGM